MNEGLLPPRILTVSRRRLRRDRARVLRTHVDRAIGENRPHLVLDLEGVDFVDSGFLGAMVEALKHLRERGGDLRIRGAGREVRTLLALTGLDRLFLSPPSPEAARGPLS
ncbi:MAG: STAS domain-containing protein [Sumerlaeia bacterium]